MIELREMATGMAALSVAFNREVDAHVAEVYHTVLGPRLDAAGWQRAVRRALEAESFFPPPAVLMRYGLSDGLPQARAVDVYDAILAHYERGDNLGPRDVAERYGTAAMEAFVAAGGVRAFAWCEPRDEPFRRKAFVEGWVETVAVDPALALPPGEEPLALAAGEPVDEERREFRRRYFKAARDRGEFRASGEPRKAPPAVIGAELTDAEWDDRRRFLLEQADELLHRGECPDGPKTQD